MTKPVVAIVPYETPRESVHRAAACCNGLAHLPQGAKVFIKPNIVFWSTVTDFPMLTLIDGIYSNGRGPGMDGHIRRTNVLAASADVLAADVVGAYILGHAPHDVPHLVHAAARQSRSLDLTDITLSGDSIESYRLRHEYDFPCTQTAEGAWLPTPFAKADQRPGRLMQRYQGESGLRGSVLSGGLIRTARGPLERPGLAEHPNKPAPARPWRHPAPHG